MCEAMLSDDLKTFHVCFDPLNKESAVKSTPPPEDQPLEKNPVENEYEKSC